MLQSDKSRKADIFILLGTLCVMAALEIIFRANQSRVSGDLKHLQDIPEISKRIGEAKGTAILFMGNSLIGEAIDKETIKAGLLCDTTKPMVIEKVVPDGTQLPDWYFIFKNRLAGAGRSPDVIIIGFAWKNALQDGGEVSTRIINFACRFNDIADLSRFGIRGPERTSEFFLSKLSSVFANHSIIRNRVLDIMVPYYREGTQFVNTASKSHVQTPKTEPQPAYSMLSRLFQMIAFHNIKSVFLAMPVVEPYTINPALIELISKNGVFLDCRDVPGLEKNMFVDPIHLGKAGQALFSRYLAERLRNIISPCSSARPGLPSAFLRNDKS
jgi:hypothetical protein